MYILFSGSAIVLIATYTFSLTSLELQSSVDKVDLLCSCVLYIILDCMHR